MERQLLDWLDAWRATEPDQPARPEAVRRLLQQVLGPAAEAKLPIAEAAPNPITKTNARAFEMYEWLRFHPDGVSTKIMTDKGPKWMRLHEEREPALEALEQAGMVEVEVKKNERGPDTRIVKAADET